MGNLSLLQGNFSTQESNQGLLHCRWILYQLNYQETLPGKPYQGLWTITIHLRRSQILNSNLWDVCCFRPLICGIISYVLPSMPVFYRNKCIRKGRCQGFISLYHLYKVKHTLRRLCPNCLRIVSINTSPSCFCFVFLLLLLFLFFFFFLLFFQWRKSLFPAWLSEIKYV